MKFLKNKIWLSLCLLVLAIALIYIGNPPIIGLIGAVLILVAGLLSTWDSTDALGKTAMAELEKDGFNSLPKLWQYSFLVIVLASLAFCAIFLPPGNSWVGIGIFTILVIIFRFISANHAKH